MDFRVGGEFDFVDDVNVEQEMNKVSSDHGVLDTFDEIIIGGETENYGIHKIYEESNRTSLSGRVKQGPNRRRN